MAENIMKPKAVVEMFTSQGCSSCPPADVVVNEYVKSGDVLAISVHVDYWDYLGWKDKFASKNNTQRQYDYAKTFSERQVYTPQAVVNGQAHTVGSKRGRIEKLMGETNGGNAQLPVSMDVSVNSDSLSIKIPSSADAANSTLYLFTMKESETVKIERGENHGKSITYHNILQDIDPLGMVMAEGLSIDFPMDELKKDDNNCYALILQKKTAQGDPSEILGAVYLSDL